MQKPSEKAKNTATGTNILPKKQKSYYFPPNGKAGKKQAEAEVVPSSSSVKFKFLKFS